jgi:glycosyltransferase involved in cell wall biosynthesis
MGAEPDDILVVLVGRLTAQKAHHHVLAIAGRLRESHPRLRFAIAGDGPRAQELAGLLETSGLQDRVRLLGVRRDVPDLLGAADIYLSCSDWEGMPLTTMEAMASSLPCVTTRTEGAALLLDDASGMVVPVGDVDALAASVATLAADADRRRRMGAAGRERAHARFSHDRVAREILELLDRVVRARGKPVAPRVTAC